MNSSQIWSSKRGLRTWRDQGLLISAVILLLTTTLAQQAGSGQTLYHVRGTVVHSLTGQPVSQVRVFLWRTPDRKEREVFMTGADGKFWFDNIPAGKYALGEAKPGFVRQDFEQHEFYSSAIVVGAGISADNLVFRIPPAGVISGQITDEQNEPVRDAQVILFQSRLREGEKAVRRVNQASSDDRGQYTFVDLAPGTYFVVVYARPWYAPFTEFAKDSGVDATEAQGSRVPTDVAYPVVYFSGATDFKQATPITLGAGDHVSADFNLNPVHSIHLRVRLPKTNPSRGCNVSATPITFDNADVPIPIPAQTLMKEPGEAEVSGLPPGPYHLLIVFPGKQPKIYKQDIDLQSDLEIDPTSSDQVGSISGLVSMADGSRPPAGLIILLRNVATEENAGARVLPDGRFEFNPGEAISPGQYEVAIASDSLFVTSISATGARLLGRNLEIHGSDSVQLSLVISKGVATIEGTAISGDEQPVAGAMILLIPDDPKNNAVLVRRDQSDSDGTFILNSVVPGRYRLLAIRKGWDLEWMNPAVLKPYLLQAQRVEIVQNGKYKWKIRVQ